MAKKRKKATPQKKGLDDQQIIDLVTHEFGEALGAPGGEISEERAEALKYYLREPFGNEEEGQSQVVSSDVADIVDGIMPSLLRMFTSQDNLISFDPVGGNNLQDALKDEAQAEQESSYVNHVFFKQNPAFLIMFYWMFDALVQKNGYVKVWWDESEDVTTEEYKGLMEFELLELMDDEELEPVERDERQGDVVNMQTGMIERGTVTDIKFKRVTKRGRVVIANVPPEEFRISGDSRNLDPSAARMVGHEREVTRDELLGMGFKKSVIDKLAEADETLSTEKLARRNKSDEKKTQGGSKDESQKLFLLREAYLECDPDGDGRAELKQVFMVDGKKLEINDSDRQPFHAISPHPLPHKHFGQASAEKEKQTQLVTSELLRQTLMNLYHSNNPGKSIWEQGIGENTMDDLLTRKVGRVARFRRPVSESVQDDVVPFTAGASFPMIEYFDRTKRDRHGIGNDTEGLTPDALKNIQTTVMMQATDQGKMKVEAVARIFAETGFKTMFLHIHELVQKHQQKEEIVKLNGQWVPVHPAEWKHRRNMTVNIGLGIGTREQNLLHLEAIRGIQAQMIEAGGLNFTVTAKNVYNTAAEYVKNANYKIPEVFFTDPGDKKLPPPSDAQQELQKKEQELKQRQQQLDGERQQLNMVKAQQAGEKQQLEHEREMIKLEEKREERLDKAFAENESLRNELTSMNIKLLIATEDRDLKEKRTDAEIEQITALAMEARARTVKTLEESEGQSIENAAADSGVEGLVEADAEETE